jgi:hypothetical protein
MSAASGTRSWTCSEQDARAVERLLGRRPLTEFVVAVRCPYGAPAVIENAHRDQRGRPFPTRWWLTCRALVDAVSRLEADGGVRALEQDERMRAALARAHALHASLHEGHRVAGVGDPDHVKCLHAHLAFALATGGSAVGAWIAAHGGVRFPERCCLG